MPRLVLTLRAAAGIERCRRFLVAKSPAAAQRAMRVIRTQIQALADAPEIGRPVENSPGVRERIIDFGDSGYVARYRYAVEDDTVYVTAFRHQREDDF